MKRIDEHGKVTFWQAGSDYFHGLFNFKGRTTRRGLAWTLIGAFVVIAFMQNILDGLTTYWQYGNISNVVENVLTWVIILSLVPVIIRRFRDAGVKGWAAFIGLVVTFVFMMVLDLLGLIMLGCLLGIMIFVPTDKLVFHKDNWLRYVLR
ncbi:DUF805 domain-containing protein [Ligilactobacillus sp. LYQ60]|uniref:DUF805 domain-containing protein n=1 Tax=unclassified Ligilactobacillus TaxID=2767920 RepID=UPI003853C6D4